MDRFEVHITEEEHAEIDGHPLVPDPGQSVHDAVLDRLQQYAQERAAAVLATVNDGSGAAHFVLQVSPDGSSRVLDAEEERQEQQEPVSAVATAVARARATAAARAVVQTPVVVADLPTEHAERIGRINELATSGRLDEAYADVCALRESLTGSLGAEHPHALEARSMEAYLAHLRGDHREATVLALGVARIRCGAGDGQASAEVARAAAAWQRIDDDRAAVVHGRELLHMWGQLDRRGQLPPGDAALVGQVRRHVDALAAYV
ncbi:hypothetical protein BN159_1232 [Streptomyces davaonensis JCM 4913]|uniref:Uncharacterized protein n=1 Tax=Streptomyces davaonensis (strain DSM 101723 / JCM 4913 / KCC S-0913 / 768) TaxID=1214101 RepID=K4QT15_STRDJ|nr:hypothetical protein [Streptomyces davaonensis]CCK25611.1 hypothetical protein BN159_1232 [Streptomyces davaonensis JCM 4913]